MGTKSNLVAAAEGRVHAGRLLLAGRSASMVDAMLGAPRHAACRGVAGSSSSDDLATSSRHAGSMQCSRDVMVADPDSDPKLNYLLDCLSAADLNCLSPHLVPVSLPSGQVICESEHKQSHVYFPTTAVISLVNVMEDGSSTEVAVVGNEGLVGIALFLGDEITASRAVVQSTGQALRLAARFLKPESDLATSMQHLLLRYTQSLITQLAQTAACNRHHSIIQQLCRWLLSRLDRLPSDELVMTQELIANTLGVRREGITVAAGKLQDAGVIEYWRGHIKVLDRPKLESMSCECYQVVKRESDRLRLDPTGKRRVALSEDSDTRTGGYYEPPACQSYRRVDGTALFSAS